MSRRWLLPISLVTHLVLGTGLVAASVWNIERLSIGPRPTTHIGVMDPPAAAGGGPLAARKVEIVRKPVHDLVQPEPVRDHLIQPSAAVASEIAGTGSGGAGSGSGDDPFGVGGCTQPPCGVGDPPAVPEPPKPPPPPVTPPPTAVVPPTVLEALRVAGETQILPPTLVANEMRRDGRARVTGAFRICLSTDGEVASVTRLVSTRYPAYDAVLAERVRSWRYRPYLVDGRPAPVCAHVTFVYSMQ